MNALKTGIRNQLTAATALTTLLSGTAAVYHGLAKGGVSLPYVVFTLVSDEEANETPRREREWLFDVKGISDAADTAGNIEAQIDAAMQTAITVTGWGVVVQERERGLSLREEADGKVYYHAGGQYRVRLEKL